MVQPAVRCLLALLVACGAPDEEPVASGPAESVDLEAPADGLTLKGTLLLPEGDRPVPVVVFMHGSGPNSRNQPAPGQLNMAFGVEIKTLLDLARGLRAAGVASYRYDKRTCGPFNGCADNGYPQPPDDITVDTFVSDAAAAVAAVAEHPGIDPSRIWVVGHSQGGQLAPLVAEKAAVHGVVMLAAPFSTVDATLRDQLVRTEELLAQSGASADQIASNTGDLRETVEAVDAIASGTYEGQAVGGASVDFWKSWLAAGKRAQGLAPALGVPLHALGGGYDWNVPPAELQQWAKAFEGAEGARSSREVPGVAHPLNELTQPDWKLLKPSDIGTAVDQRVIDFVSGVVNNE